MGRGKKNQPESWACSPTAKNKHFTRVYVDLLESKPFLDLTPKQKVLYLYCCRETYGRATRDDAERSGGQGDGRLFYMNKALYVKRYSLYGENDGRGFPRDMTALVEHGFVDCLFRGGPSRQLNLYRVSSRWQKWGTPEYVLPEKYMTTQQLKELEDRNEVIPKKPAPDEEQVA